MSQPKRRSKFRLNVRAASILGIGLLIVVSGFVVLTYARSRLEQPALLKQALQQAKAEPPKYDVALKYLNEYLVSHPNDPVALENKATILAKIAVNAEQLGEAIQMAEATIRVDPAAPRTQAMLKLLVEMDLRMRQFRPLEGLRMQTAEKNARDLIAKGDDSPEALRLLAEVLEIQAVLGDRKSLDESVAVYEQARKLDALNVEGAEQLSAIYQNPLRLNQPKKAEQVLDAVLKANLEAETAAKDPAARAEASQGVAQAYLARFRHFARAARLTKAAGARKDFIGRAAEELRLALAKSPKDVSILLTAAENELQRGDVAKARAYYDSIPADPETPRDKQQVMRIHVVEGLIDMTENHPDEAIESWQEGLVATGGTDADLTWKLAYIQLQLGRLEEAKPLLLQHRRITGGSEPTPDHRFLEGLKLFRENQPRKAIDTLTKALPKIDSSRASKVRFLLGQCYEAVRDEASAIEQYTKVAQEEPKWAAPRLARARLLQARRPFDAQQEIAQVEADLQDDPQAILTGARLALRHELTKPPQQRSWDDLNGRIEHLKTINPNSPELALFQAEVLVNTGKPAEAAALLEQAVRHDKSDAGLWVAWATILARMNKSDDALRVLEQAAAPDAVGDTAALRITHARLLNQLGNGEKAREVLVHGEEDLSMIDRPLVWAELGSLLHQRHQDEEARKAFQRYADLLPDDPRPRLMLMELALRAGDREKAAEAIEALKAITGPTGLYYRVALAQDLLRETPEGKSEDAADRADRYARAEKLIAQIENVAPQERYGYMLRGLLHERRGEPAKAIAAYERALIHDGGQDVITRLVKLYTSEGRFEDLQAMRDAQSANATAITELGALEAFRQGNKDVAERLADQLVAGDPESLDVRVWQARLLNSMGKPDEAEKSLRDLISRHAEESGPWLALFFFQVGRKQNDQALTTIEQMKQKAKNVDLPEFLYAQCYRAAGDMAKADAAFDQALEKWPLNPNVVRGAVELDVMANRPADAEKVLRDYLAKAPDQRWAVRRLAGLLAEHPKDGESWQQAWDLVKDTPPSGDTPEDRLIRAAVLLQHPERAAKYGEIETILKQLIADIPADRPAAVSARNLLVDIYQRQGRNDEVRALTAITATDLTNPRSLAVHIETLIRDGELEEADGQLKRLTALAPDDVLTLKLRAFLLDARKQHGQAVALLERGFADRAGSDGGEAACRNIVAMFGGVDGVPPIDDLKTGERLATDLAKRWPASSWMLARILGRAADAPVDRILDLCATAVAEGNGIDLLQGCTIAISLSEQPNASEDAKTRTDGILANATKREPTNLDVLLATAALRYSQKRYDDAVAAYRAAGAARPTNPRFLNNLAWILSEELNRPQEGLDAINELFSRVPAVPEFLDTRASIYAHLGRTAEAIEDWNRAVAQRPDNPSYAYRLARAYLKSGDDANFQKWMAAAKKAGLSPDSVQPSERDELQTPHEPLNNSGSRSADAQLWSAGA